MGSLTLVSVEEYLTTVYHPDRDYVDGELLERNMGEEAHGEIQAIIARIIGNHRLDWGVRVYTETRVQTSETHYRIPDVCVVPSTRPRGTIIRYAPLLCIEILSPEDRMSRMMNKLEDYVRLGVDNIWVIDPEERVGYYAAQGKLDQAEDNLMKVTGTPILIDLAEVFAEFGEA